MKESILLYKSKGRIYLFLLHLLKVLDPKSDSS